MSIEAMLSSHCYEIEQRSKYWITGEKRDIFDRIFGGDQLYIQKKLPRENRIFELLLEDITMYFKSSITPEPLDMFWKSSFLRELGTITHAEEDDLPYQRLRHLGLFVFESIEEELRKLPPIEESSPENILKEDFIDEIGFSSDVKKYLREYVKLSFQLFDSDVGEYTITLFANYVLSYWLSLREIFQILGSEQTNENE